MSKTAKYLAIQQKCVNCCITEENLLRTESKNKNLNYIVDSCQQGVPLCFSRRQRLGRKILRERIYIYIKFT
jgi:hypothetical protein